MTAKTQSRSKAYLLALEYELKFGEQHFDMLERGAREGSFENFLLVYRLLLLGILAWIFCVARQLLYFSLFF
jgi:hypothetical protein